MSLNKPPLSTALSIRNEQTQLRENARVVAVEQDAVWLETIRHSSCGQCALQKGCGQSLLQSLFKTARHHMRLSTVGLDIDLQLDDQVEIGIPNAAVLQGSLILYLLPLLAMIAAMIGATQLALNEGFILLFGFSAMALSMLAIRLVSNQARFQRAIEPKILRRLNSFNNEVLGESGAQQYIDIKVFER